MPNRNLYMVVAEEEYDELERRITEYLENGWRPCGGITIDESGGTKYFLQAIYNATALAQQQAMI